jgi:hypothetical protein
MLDDVENKIRDGVAPRWGGAIKCEWNGEPGLVGLMRGDYDYLDLCWLSRMKLGEPDVSGSLKIVESDYWGRLRSVKAKLNWASVKLGLGDLSDWETCGCVNLCSCKSDLGRIGAWMDPEFEFIWEGLSRMTDARKRQIAQSAILRAYAVRLGSVGSTRARWARGAVVHRHMGLGAVEDWALQKQFKRHCLPLTR